MTKSMDEKKAGLAWQAAVVPPADCRGSGMGLSAGGTIPTSSPLVTSLLPLEPTLLC